MGDSSQLTPLSTSCKQPGPVIWFPLFLSLTSPLSKASIAQRNLIYLWSFANKTSKISKKKQKKKTFLCNIIYNVNIIYVTIEKYSWKII